MASLLLFRDGASSVSVTSHRSLAGTVISVMLSFAAISVLLCFLTQRSLAVKAWSRISLDTLLVFAIYLDSWAFVFGSGIVDYGLGVDSNLGVCSAAILLCLFFYVTSKFLIQGGTKRRIESKLYIFNLFGVLTILAVICILTFVYRASRIIRGQCIVGIERQALIPLIVVDIVANVHIYSLQTSSQAPASSPSVQRAAIRPFVGALCTTASSIVNLVVLMVLNGEPGWIFLACCNADSDRLTNRLIVLLSTLVIQWVTSRDGDSCTNSLPTSSDPSDSQATYRSPPRALSLSRRRGQKLTISRPLKTTSTSQYEHIFGDLEPETETDIVSASSASKHKAGSSRFDEDNDGFHTPIIYDGPEGDISDGARNEGTSSSIWTSPQVPPLPPPSARADARADDRASALGKSLSLTPAPSPTPTRECSSMVSAAVAADLERIRRYRGRRTHWTSSTTATTSTPPPPPPPPAAASTSMASTSHSPARVPPSATPPSPSLSPSPSSSSSPPRRPAARGSVREYYISQLAFEEPGAAGSRWHDLIKAEAGDADADADADDQDHDRDEQEGRGESGHDVVGWI
ncbi:hypothetical protein F5Y11DRAFT_358341 [Daldinia sp. FL1419]|nr:hypothetical protein F5Y11DRAFT_358341 [Daldinia sp. FL1419]